MRLARLMKTTNFSRRAGIAFEIIAFVAFALLSRAALMDVAWRFAGPLSLFCVLVVLTLYMHWRGRSWREFGLVRLAGRKAKLWVLVQALMVFAAFCAAVASVLIAAHVFDLAFMEKIPQGVTDRWGDVHGNLPLLLLWLVIAWLSGGFAEEMFFRGYLVTRLRELFANERAVSIAASVLAVVLAAAFFGYGHMYYQGLRGLVTAGAIGVAFGTMFLVFKGNLWPVILVHAIVDTIAFIGTYTGAN